MDSKKVVAFFHLFLGFAVVAGALTRVNDSCVDNNFDNLHSNVFDALEKIAALKTYNYAKILSYNSTEVQVLSIFKR